MLLLEDVRGQQTWKGTTFLGYQISVSSGRASFILFGNIIKLARPRSPPAPEVSIVRGISASGKAPIPHAAKASRQVTAELCL
jgi:hypothetical protein